MPEGKDFEACGVCGRTILRGEQVAEYVTPSGERPGVCALCKPGAEAAGWVPAELAGGAAHDKSARRRGLGLRERLSRASEAARGLAARPERERAPEREQGGREQGGREQAIRAKRPQRTARDPGKPPARGTDRGRRQSAEPGPRGTPRARANEGPPHEGPPSPERRLRNGVERFNASAEPRKVAGLIRALGEPRVTVRPSSGGAVVVTVAWELSWYQWEVGAQGSNDAVRETGKGGEVSELGLRDRDWNAHAGSDGKVVLEAAAARQTSAQRE